jgi:aminoglycoside 6'-N-acetyltransferase I
MIENILKSIPNFTENEISVAMELVNIAASNEQQMDYNIFVYEHGNKILGYHCTGKRPLTDGVFDLYWIVADPQSGIKGVGKKLLENAEEFVKSNRGRWLLAETSSKDNYSGTRNFYLRNNYSIIAEINDFYSVGDNLLIFGKYFNNKK